MWRLLIVLLALAPTGAEALEIRTGGIVAIRESDHVQDDLLAIAPNVSVLGRVDGDVYALGQLVAVAGQVGGDVIAVGQELRLGGRVGGDTRGAADLITMFGDVERNVAVAARRVESSARVGGSWTGWAERASVGGRVGRGLWLTASAGRLDGQVAGPARVTADTVAIGPAARLPTGLEYWSAADAAVAPPAQVSALTRHEPRPSRELARARELAAGAGRLLAVALLASSLVASVLLGLLAPRAPLAAAEQLAAHPVRCLALGLASLVVPLPLAFLLALTVLGLPLAAGLAGLWGLGIGLGWVLGAAALAGLLDRVGRGSAVGAPSPPGPLSRMPAPPAAPPAGEGEAFFEGASPSSSSSGRTGGALAGEGGALALCRAGEPPAPAHEGAAGGAALVGGAAAGPRAGEPAPRWGLPPALLCVAGAAVLWLVGQLPVVGTIAAALATIAGTGSLLRLLWRARLAP